MIVLQPPFLWELLTAFHRATRFHTSLLNIYDLLHPSRVGMYSSKNRMDTGNLSIVFGPTLMFPDPKSININTNMSVITVYQNRCVELLLIEYENVFEDSYNNKKSSDMLWCRLSVCLSVCLSVYLTISMLYHCLPTLISSTKFLVL